jgi:hypothetical protein
MAAPPALHCRRTIGSVCIARALGPAELAEDAGADEDEVGSFEAEKTGVGSARDWSGSALEKCNPSLKCSRGAVLRSAAPRPRIISTVTATGNAPIKLTSRGALLITPTLSSLLLLPLPQTFRATCYLLPNTSSAGAVLSCTLVTKDCAKPPQARPAKGVGWANTPQVVQSFTPCTASLP